MMRDPLIGTLFGRRFRVESLLGQGGMAAVYLVRHEVLNRVFALKLLRSRLRDDPLMLARFKDEARAAARIENPHIVGIYDFGHTDDGLPFLVMEYVKGITLSELVSKQGFLPVPRAVNILLQTAEALSAAHEGGVIHRDLKPQNIMLTSIPGRPEFVKVLDFGLAIIIRNDMLVPESLQGYYLGTPKYAPPEVLADKPVDARADLYSLGVVAFELLVGKPPFTGSPVEVLDKHLGEVPPRASNAACRTDIPTELDDIVACCLAKEPEHRFPSADVLAAELRALGRGGHRSGAPIASASTSEAKLDSPGALSSAQTPPSGPPGLAWQSTENLLATSESDPLRAQRAALRDLCFALRDRGLGSPSITEQLAELVLLEEELARREATIRLLKNNSTELEIGSWLREGRLLKLLGQIEHEITSLRSVGEDANGKTLPMSWGIAAQEIVRAILRLEDRAGQVRQALEHHTEEVAAMMAELDDRTAEIDAAVALLRPEVEELQRALANHLVAARDEGAWPPNPEIDGLYVRSGLISG